jgi:hypothetical protein
MPCGGRPRRDAGPDVSASSGGPVRRATPASRSPHPRRSARADGGTTPAGRRHRRRRGEPRHAAVRRRAIASTACATTATAAVRRPGRPRRSVSGIAAPATAMPAHEGGARQREPDPRSERPGPAARSRPTATDSWLTPGRQGGLPERKSEGRSSSQPPEPRGRTMSARAERDREDSTGRAAGRASRAVAATWSRRPGRAGSGGQRVSASGSSPAPGSRRGRRGS